MSATLHIPTIRDAQAFHLKRWQAVCADSSVHSRAERIETNRYGQIVMVPRSGFSHSI